LILDQAIIS